jgi:hypothetical protein
MKGVVMRAKYKIGDILIPKLSGEENTRLHVIQIEEITCSAGTQTCYIGTIWRNELGKRKTIIARMIKLNETEIFGIEEPISAQTLNEYGAKSVG